MLCYAVKLVLLCTLVTFSFLRRVAQFSRCKLLVLANEVVICKNCLLNQQLSPLYGVNSVFVMWCQGESFFTVSIPQINGLVSAFFSWKR